MVMLCVFSIKRPWEGYRESESALASQDFASWNRYFSIEPGMVVSHEGRLQNEHGVVSRDTRLRSLVESVVCEKPSSGRVCGVVGRVHKLDMGKYWVGSIHHLLAGSVRLNRSVEAFGPPILLG